jgi:probable phosphoglycerate mutase
LTADEAADPMSRPLLYYIRHGETDWNKAARLQGRHDIPLNDDGRAQAARCGKRLADVLARDGRSPGQCGYVSSPLVRARETMEIIRAAIGLPREGADLDDRLVEIAFGEWEGLTYRDVLARDKDVVQKREGSKWLFRPPGGETYAEVAERVGRWYAELTRPTVVTAHGGTGRAIVAMLGILEPEAAAHQPIEQDVIYVLSDRILTRHA